MKTLGRIYANLEGRENQKVHNCFDIICILYEAPRPVCFCFDDAI